MPPEEGPLRLDASAPGFEREFSAFLGRNRDTDENVDRIAAGIVADVRKRGDAALVELSKKFDRVDLDKVGITGHSGGGFASTRAILAYPEFFKVAVSLSGSHDVRLTQSNWGEINLGSPRDNPDSYVRASNVEIASTVWSNVRRSTVTAPW